MTSTAPVHRTLSIVSVPVSDQSEARRFYTDILDFELVRDHPMEDGSSRWVQVRPRGAETSLVLVTWFPAMQPGSVAGLVLETGDIDRDLRLLRGRGVALDEPKNAPWGRFTTFRDPDGNEWVLQQPTTEVAD